MPRWTPRKSSAIRIIAELSQPERDDPVELLVKYESVRVVAELWRTHPGKIAEAVWYERHPTLDPLVRAPWYDVLLFPLGAPNAETEKRSNPAPSGATATGHGRKR